MITKPSPPHKRGRPAFGFLLVDLPSDHEIDGGIITESQMIHAMLHNRMMRMRTKIVRATSRKGFVNMSGSYKGIGFVHLATHGSAKGISLIGATMSWEEVASKLTKLAPKLRKEQKRVLCLSCCNSFSGYEAMKFSLTGHFTMAYYFPNNTINFSTALTVWSMFYNQKTLDKPLGKIAKSINNFIGPDTIAFEYISPRTSRSQKTY